MMREETDEEIVREAIGVAEDEGYTELYQDAIAALDRLVAERDRALEMMRSVPEWSRAEAAEKERDEALRRMDAAELEADNQGEMAEKAEARCATLEAALRTVRDNIGVPQDSLTPAPLAYAYEVACEALAAASQPAEET